MSPFYNKTAERLWEKLEAEYSYLIVDCVDFTQPFPYDQFVKVNPVVDRLRKEVEEEFNYEMSECQGSWAVNAFLRWNPVDYANTTGVRVIPRA